MKSRTIGNIKLVYSGKETETADLIADTCEKAIQLAEENWGLRPPEDCRIYVMTSWFGFVFQSAPWRWRLLLAPTIPLWYARIHRTWKYSAAWTQNYSGRIAIGVKPARLLEQSDRSIGVRMFVEEKDSNLNVQHVTCHELVHACSAHLRLPMWLNEGIATVTTDRFLGRPTIKEDTLKFMKDYLPKAAPPTYRKLSRMSGEAIAYHGSRGYWLVRYLEKERPGFLKGMLAIRKDSNTIERNIAEELGIAPESFWNEIDDIVADYFMNGT
ncbi:hypothetical protein ACFLTB_03800 [Chloroflexota bacterium]